MKETVCVTGGSGGIGQALLERLTALYQVKALFRTKTAISDKWERRGCIPIWGDIRNDEALSALVTGAKFVFHCAAMVGQGSYDDCYAVNVEGTRRLARAAGQNGCHRFVHISSAAVYSGARSDKDYTEEIELSENDEMAVYALTKLQSERALKEVAREYGLEYTILRPTCVYGPNTKPYTLTPINLMRKGLPVMVGNGEAVLDVVYVDDVVSALLLAAQCAGANREVFNIGHETVTFNHFHSHYARMLNRPARHLPFWVIRVILQLMQRVPGSRKRRSPELQKGFRCIIKMYENTKKYPSTKAKAVLGYTPQCSLPTGMLKTELWLKQRRIIPLNHYSLPGYGRLRFRPLAVAHPTREEEIVQINQMALHSNIKARAIGSLHSLCPIPETDGVCIVLDKYNNLLKVDGSLVTVQAGMTLRELNEILAERDLALPVSGAITRQTVSGAISTATHGGSIYYGSLSDYVDSVRIVRADGRIAEIDRAQDPFEAAVVSMGLLGVTSNVTFQCVPSFALRSRICIRKAQEIIDHFDDINRSSLYVDMLYFPITDEVEILCIDRIENEEVGKRGHAEDVRHQDTPSTLNSRTGQQLVTPCLKSVAWLLHYVRCNALQRFVLRLLSGSSYKPRVGRSDFVLAFLELGSDRRSPIPDMEIAVAYDQAGAVITVLRDHFATTRRYPLFPIHIRCSAASGLWLSPSYKRDVCWLEFWQYPRSDSLFEEMHALLEPFHYRFHWGKETRADHAYIKQQYARWDDFVRLHAEWDPAGVFLNRYLDSFFTARNVREGGAQGGNC